MKFSLFLFSIFLISCHENVVPKEIHDSTSIDTTVVSREAVPAPTQNQKPNNSSPRINFRIELHQRTMTSDENYVFSNDSIFGIAKLKNGKPTKSILVNINTDSSEAAKLLLEITNLKLDTMASAIRTNTANGSTIYNFTLMKGNTSKQGGTNNQLLLHFVEDILSLVEENKKENSPMTYISLSIEIK